MNKKAEMGVGTLIIFIALLLVAAVAAGVLIQTAGSLQQRALSTGSQATGQIATSAVALEVSGTDGTGTLEDLEMIMKLAPGSESIRLEAVTLTLSTSNTTQTFTYSGDNTFNASEFGVTYLQQGTNSQTGVIVRGDVINVLFQAERALLEAEDVRISFIPQIGTPTVVQFGLPDVISTERVYLYP
jgi:archaeal flagellin FlaB